MSAEKRKAEARRWLLQTQDDWEAGKALLQARKFAQAAFLAQQAGEKALKGLWLFLGLDPWSDSLARLLRDLPGEEAPAFQHLLPQALSLDKLYIPTRYPDALPGLTPKEAYTEEEAEKALEDAKAILEAVEVRLAG
ncbi:DNA-binding protein [Thermus sp. 2.9]|uniref:HEPN domain-containing protein n=1 Tax=Thermus sp. (strain 2.9) TaxID=1577051 RepID=UPI000543A819|nr:HEPN domain-containing protein [Thermus sp. 2.9]KHG65906.1 DNA-binding protein [Thermus sp. 2.9]